jgi:hypothetical protein
MMSTEPVVFAVVSATLVSPDLPTLDVANDWARASAGAGFYAVVAYRAGDEAARTAALAKAAVLVDAANQAAAGLAPPGPLPPADPAPPSTLRSRVWN